jgi:hypothetical protein
MRTGCVVGKGSSPFPANFFLFKGRRSQGLEAISPVVSKLITWSRYN